MPKAKKLASGSWRCQIVDHYEMVDGKRKVVKRSITVDDPSPHGKKKCELLAAQYQARNQGASSGLKIKDAISRYISAKESVLSPTTLHAYRSLERTAYNDIEHLRIAQTSREALQYWVGQYALDHSPKTVRNAVALLTATYEMFEEPFPRLTLPQKRPPVLSTPTDADIKSLLDAVTGTELEKAILLAAFGTLRRGEICALEASDLDGNILTVSRSLVATDDGFVLKDPKTPSSIRRIVLPPVVADRIRVNDGRIVNMTPHALTDKFERERNKLGLTFRFHDLRAYAVSIRHALGIPDVYIMQAGGWKTDAVPKAIYRRAMDDKRVAFENIANEHFTKIMSS